MMERGNVDLRTCKRGDILLSALGAKLEYIAPTPYKGHTYLDHVVKYLENEKGESFGEKCFGTRTHDGYVYKKKRTQETDHDIVKIFPR